MDYNMKLSSEALGLVVYALINLSQSEKRDALAKSLINQAVEQYKPQVTAKIGDD
jgi:hypothetical protein